MMDTPSIVIELCKVSVVVVMYVARSLLSLRFMTCLLHRNSKAKNVVEIHKLHAFYIFLVVIGYK